MLGLSKQFAECSPSGRRPDRLRLGVIRVLEHGTVGGAEWSSRELDVHHVVAAALDGARPARAVMTRWDVNIHNVVNAAILPRAFHQRQGLHRQAFLEVVNRKLLSADMLANGIFSRAGFATARLIIVKTIQSMGSELVLRSGDAVAFALQSSLRSRLLTFEGQGVGRQERCGPSAGRRTAGGGAQWSVRIVPEWEQNRTMKLHLLQGDLDFHWLQPADGALWNCRGGVPVAVPWQAPRLLLSPDDAADEFLPVDCLSMNAGCDGPILSGYAREALGGLLAPAGEFWPVDVLGHRYWWFNCLATVEALDADRTDAEWDVVDGDWGQFRWITTPRQLAFLPMRVAAAPAVFRVPEFPQGALFVGDSIERAIEEYGLTGFKLDLVWSADEGGVRDPAGFGFAGVFEEQSAGDVARKRAWARAALQDRRM